MPGEKNFFQTFGEAFAKGDIFTKVSFLVWGLGYIGHGQLMKALLVTLVEGLGLYFLAFYGAPNLAKFGTLGTVKMEMVFDVTTMKNVVNNYDNSFEILLMSMISFVVIAALIAAAMMVVTSNYQLQKIRAAGKKTNNFLQDINVYLNEKFYVTLLTLPVLGVVVFTIVPLFSLIALLLLYGVGAADDVFGVRYCYKLAVQLLCGTLIVSSGLYFGNFYGAFGLCELPQWFACPFTVIVLMLLCNAMNFIDGIDGLAAGITIIACIYMGTVFLIVTNYSFGFIAFAAVGTLLPFFYYNVFGNAKSGRKIFMGDAGSLTLGLMLGILAIKMCQTEQIEQNTGVNPVVAAMSVLIVPVFDLLRVFIFRIVHHKSPFLPDRNHIHHRLMSAGLNQHQALIVLLLTTVLFTGLSIVLSRDVSATLIFIADVLVWAAAHGVVAHAIGKARGANG